MTAKRRRIANMTERLAAAYIALGLVPEPLRSSGSAAAIVGYIEADHNILHCLGGDTRPQNLNLLPKPVHREKSRIDTAIAAKVTRIADKEAEFRQRCLARGEGIARLPRLTRKGNAPLPCGRGSSWMKRIGRWNAVPRLARR